LDQQRESQPRALHGESGVHGDPVPQAAYSPGKGLAASQWKTLKRRSALQVPVLQTLLADQILRHHVQVDVERQLHLVVVSALLNASALGTVVRTILQCVQTKIPILAMESVEMPMTANFHANVMLGVKDTIIAARILPQHVRHLDQELQEDLQRLILANFPHLDPTKMEFPMLSW